MLILQLAYGRADQHFWNGPEMVVNIFILRHVDQAKKGMYHPNISRLHSGQKPLPTCWHSLSPASVFYWFSEVKLQYSVSCFVVLQYLKNWWNLQQYFFQNKLLYCSVLRNWNKYYCLFCKNLVLLI